MSRVGRKPIAIPEKVKVTLQDQTLNIEGPQGKLFINLPTGVTVEVDPKQLLIKRENEQRDVKSKHGLVRALIANMVVGVTHGFKKELDITGVGYRAEVKGKDIHMTLGFSHSVAYPIPEGIKAIVEKQTHITLTGADKELIGRVASEIRNIKPPEPYKGKGVRYSQEKIRRKAGKAAGAGAKAK